MRILLVKPNARLDTILKLRPLLFMEPLELGCVAASAPPGCETRVLDLRLFDDSHEERLAKTLAEFRPDIVGFSSYTHEASQTRRLARVAKEALGKVFVVVGGHHATVMPLDFDTPHVDAVVMGEGTSAFRRLVETLRDGRREDIENVLFCGIGAKAPPPPVHPGLEMQPTPDRRLWNWRDYRSLWPTLRHDGGTIFPPVALLRTSYGCRMNCSFCVVPALSGRRHHSRPAPRVVEELKSLEAGHVYFCDDETFLDGPRISALADEIRWAGIEKRYFAWARSTTVNRGRDLILKWRDIGLDCVFLGVEAVTDTELARLSKRATVEDNRRAHEFLHGNKIACVTGLMLDPGHTHEDFDRLERHILDMPPAQLNITVRTPSPGSEAWRSESQSFVRNHFDLHDCMHPLTRTRLPLREFFERYARLSRLSESRHPLRECGGKIPLLELAAVREAGENYALAIERAVDDHPNIHN